MNRDLIHTLNPYRPTRTLPNGDLIGICNMIYTVGLVVGIDQDGNYRTRFCYPTRAEAEHALRTWDGTGFPPGFWIKQKPEGTSNPNKAPKL